MVRKFFAEVIARDERRLFKAVKIALKLVHVLNLKIVFLTQYWVIRIIFFDLGQLIKYILEHLFLDHLCPRPVRFTLIRICFFKLAESLLLRFLSTSWAACLPKVRWIQERLLWFFTVIHVKQEWFLIEQYCVDDRCPYWGLIFEILCLVCAKLLVLTFLFLFCQHMPPDFDSASNLMHSSVVKEVKKERACKEIRDSGNDNLCFPWEIHSILVAIICYFNSQRHYDVIIEYPCHVDPSACKNKNVYLNLFNK